MKVDVDQCYEDLAVKILKDIAGDYMNMLANYEKARTKHLKTRYLTELICQERNIKRHPLVGLAGADPEAVILSLRKKILGRTEL